MNSNYDTRKTIVVVALIAGAVYAAGNHSIDCGLFLFLAWIIW